MVRGRNTIQNNTGTISYHEKFWGLPLGVFPGVKFGLANLFYVKTWYYATLTSFCPNQIMLISDLVSLKLLRIYRQDCRNLSFYSENSFLKRELLLVDLIIASVAGQREGLSDRSLLWAIGLIHLWQMTAGQLSNYKWHLNMWVINLPTFMSRV